MDRSRQADAADALATATNEVYSRSNAMFYLATVGYIGRVADDAAAGDTIMAYLTADESEIPNASRAAAAPAPHRTRSALPLTNSDLITVN